MVYLTAKIVSQHLWGRPGLKTITIKGVEHDGKKFSALFHYFYQNDKFSPHGASIHSVHSGRDYYLQNIEVDPTSGEAVNPGLGELKVFSFTKRKLISFNEIMSQVTSGKAALSKVVSQLAEIIFTHELKLKTIELYEYHSTPATPIASRQDAQIAQHPVTPNTNASRQVDTSLNVVESALATLAISIKEVNEKTREDMKKMREDVGAVNKQLAGFIQQTYTKAEEADKKAERADKKAEQADKKAEQADKKAEQALKEVEAIKQRLDRASSNHAATITGMKTPTKASTTFDFLIATATSSKKDPLTFNVGTSGQNSTRKNRREMTFEERRQYRKESWSNKRTPSSKRKILSSNVSKARKRNKDSKKAPLFATPAKANASGQRKNEGSDKRKLVAALRDEGRAHYSLERIVNLSSDTPKQ